MASQPITGEELLAVEQDGPDIEALVAFLKEEETKAQDEYLDQERANALDFYNGEPFGDEEEGRSQVVTRDVAEVVDYMTVSLLRTMVSGDKVVEFDHLDPEIAQQATAAVTQEFYQGQDGYRVLHDWIKAGLLEKTSVAKCCVEAQPPRRVELTMPPEAMVQLEQEGGQIIAADPVDSDPATGEPTAFHVAALVPQPPRFRDYVTPNEEIGLAPDMRDMDDDAFIYVSFRRARTLSDLAKDGFDTTDLSGDAVFSSSDQILATARDQGISPYWQNVTNREGPNRKVWHREEYVTYDLNGDGIAELLLVHRVDNTILTYKDGSYAIEEIDQQPGVVWCPFPMPHRIVGQSLADKVMDIQRVRSVLMRQGLDNLYQTNAPRMAISESAIGDTTLDDLLTVRANGIIRYVGAQKPEPVALPFAADAAFQVMEVFAGEKESRTGITRLNQGLDADALNKMLCIETPVPMASGDYKRLAEIEDGDWLIGSDGGPVRVSRAHKIHEPERAYRIRFSSGEEIDAGGEHLWTVQTDNDKRYRKFQTVDTDRLFEMMQGKGLVYIPRVQRPLTGAERELPLDPYLLGTWLGDGSLHAPRITTADAETVEYAEAWAEEYGGLTLDRHQNSGAAKSYYVKGLYPILRAMKMLKRGDTERDAEIVGKHIPEEYFRASYRQRLELLRGLMDTDGCHHSNALCVFVQKSGRLLDDFVRLVESLGGWPSVRPASADGAFQVTFSLADCPFRLSRKAKGWSPPRANATTQVVKSIERIAIKPMRCLTVAAEDGLFCVGRRFTVTHNTATGTALMQASGQQIEEYLARNFAEAFARLMLKKYHLMRKFGRPMQVVIDGETVTIDPRQWPDDMNAVVRVGLGSGRKDQRIQYRMTLLQVMQAAAQAGSRTVTDENVYAMLKGLAADMNLDDVRDILTDPSQLPPQPDKPDPEMVKAQAGAMIDARKQQASEVQMQVDHMLAAQKMQNQFELDQQALAAKLESERQKTALEQELARDKAVFEANLAKETADRQFELDRLQIERNHELRLREQEAQLSQMRPGGALDE